MPNKYEYVFKFVRKNWSDFEIRIPATAGVDPAARAAEDRAALVLFREELTLHACGDMYLVRTEGRGVKHMAKGRATGLCWKRKDL